MPPRKNSRVPLTLGQVTISGAACEIMTLAPGFKVQLVAAAATTIGLSEDVGVMEGFVLPAGCPVTFECPADFDPITLFGTAAMGSSVSYAVSALAAP